MKKLLAIVTLLFVLVVTPVLASSDKNSNDSCDDGDFDNHGQYVSCVAKSHPGGLAVSSAAKSDIGKKDHDDDWDDDEDDDDDIIASPTPSASPSVLPSPTVSPSPTASPSPEFSGEQRGILNSIVEKLNDLIELLNNLLK